MRNHIILTLALLFAATPGVSTAKSDQHSAHHVAADAAQVPLVDGEVRKIDKDAAKITLRHGEIKHLEMPAMTMVFQVKDKAMLDTVKVGDKVRFAAEGSGGALTIIAIERAN